MMIVVDNAHREMRADELYTAAAHLIYEIKIKVPLK